MSAPCLFLHFRERMAPHDRFAICHANPVELILHPQTLKGLKIYRRMIR